MFDVLIIGAGVIGLSLAWELAKRGKSVQVVDQGDIGREASWAGAGILPSATFRPHDHPLDQLRGLACQLHPLWAAELAGRTQIDTSYRRCGGLYLARTPGEAAALAAWAGSLGEEGIAAHKLSRADLLELEPGLGLAGADGARPVASAWLLPGEAQLRNPRYLQALAAACRQVNVQFQPQTAATGAICKAGSLQSLVTSAGTLPARQFCFTSGAWTGVLLQRLGHALGIVPIRGQMVLFRATELPIRRIVNEGSRYLVPRDDGYVLAGSTEEEAGFDKRNTEEAIADLTEFARALIPALCQAPIERTWAGLRPGSFDGLPYLSRLPGLENAYVAAGHFRTGLYLSPSTARVMSQLMCGEQPDIDLSPFRVGR